MDRIMNKKEPHEMISVVFILNDQAIENGKKRPLTTEERQKYPGLYNIYRPMDYHGMVVKTFKPKPSLCERIMAFFR